MRRLRSNDRGFSLVELIVVIAIMAVLLGVMALSLNLLMGTEAKQACSKLDGQLNEVKTSAMSRYDETLKLKYYSKADTDAVTGAKNGIDKPGYYAVKDITTLTNPIEKTEDYDPTTEDKDAITQPVGAENRRIGSDRVKITVISDSGSNVIKSDSQTGVGEVTIKYDRAKGALKELDIDGTAAGNLKSITFESGVRKYTISFEQSTGKHWIE